jgi:hypothetical protein
MRSSGTLCGWIVLVLVIASLIAACGDTVPELPQPSSEAAPTAVSFESTMEDVSAPAEPSTEASIGTPTAEPGSVDGDGGLQKPTLIDGPGLVRRRCTSCHSLDRVSRASKSRIEWAQTVDRHVKRGMRLNPEERAGLIEYLAITYGPP